jgi:hypothetical protein
MFSEHKSEAPNDEHQDHESGPSIVARFESQAEARGALKALHKAHYTHTWLGTTSVATTSTGEEALTVESSSGFFSHTHSLVDALVSHGVLGDIAREIERTIVPGDALLTVDPKDRAAAEAISLLERYGGHIAGHTAHLTTDLRLPPSEQRAPRTSQSPADTMPTYGEEDMFYQRNSTMRR